MARAGRWMLGSAGAATLFCSGCLGDAVRDFVVDQIDARGDQQAVADNSESSAQPTVKDSASTARPVVRSGETGVDAFPPGNSSRSADTARGSLPGTPSDAPETFPAAPPADIVASFDQDAGDPLAAVPNDLPPAITPVHDSGNGLPAEGPPPIRLRAAVALAQTLPTGTAMGFSLDYQCTGALPGLQAQGSQVRYLWVIKPPSGPPLEAVVRLQPQGNLQTFIPQWGPVRGTYEMWIDEATRSGRRTVSRPIAAAYQY